MASPGFDIGHHQHSDATPEPAFQEAQKWIEAVTGRRFGDKDFRGGLENGILLCELLSSIKPGLVKKINRLPTPHSRTAAHCSLSSNRAGRQTAMPSQQCGQGTANRDKAGTVLPLLDRIPSHRANNAATAQRPVNARPVGLPCCVLFVLALCYCC
ncbi:hypothetical protein SKAU_G00034530 [Synaphobranchus kaupii]|uniref:Calponin-homology (CH) domain-containing protein n=1 Tax=Synaphobranchus kaupii TaxID=118154 RepID=A0A9Q1GFR7_SYNKA|nr:hypothetical protein SKAU_G00034530 [Synaphobranchus kaupii]